MLARTLRKSENHLGWTISSLDFKPGTSPSQALELKTTCPCILYLHFGSWGKQLTKALANLDVAGVFSLTKKAHACPHLISHSMGLLKPYFNEAQEISNPMVLGCVTHLKSPSLSPALDGNP